MNAYPRPFRFGAVMSAAVDAHAWADSGRELEASGYSVLLVPDTLWTPSPFPVLAAAAAGTTTLRLGTWVLSAPLRAPAEVVREAKTLQQLTGGRLELGIGAGRPGGQDDAARLGAMWATPRERVDRVQQTAAAVSDEVDPAPRIVIAGQGDRMLRIAGCVAETLALPASPMADIRELTAMTGRVATVAGRHLELALQITGVGDDVPDWIRHRMGMTADHLRHSGAAALLSGDLEQDVDLLRAIRDQTGISYFTIAGEYARRLEPLTAALAGR